MEALEIDALLARLKQALDETHRIQGEVLALFRLMLAKSQARTSQAGEGYRPGSRGRRNTAFLNRA